MHGSDIWWDTCFGAFGMVMINHLHPYPMLPIEVDKVIALQQLVCEPAQKP